MPDWEEKFKAWASPPSDSEEERIDRTIREVRSAIAASPALNTRDISVFVQGSYRNNTNVKRESDVDIGILCRDTFFFDLPAGTVQNAYGISPASYYYETFKGDVGAALAAHFRYAIARRGNKVFDVTDTARKIEADVAPFFEYRLYDASGEYAEGVELRPDSGGRVINWPEQHNQQGVAKNNRTGRRYKALVRALKCLRTEMSNAGNGYANPITGFLVECLLANVPDDHFTQPTYYESMRWCLAYLFNHTADDATSAHLLEVSQLKKLFSSGQKWTRSDVNGFLAAAWRYVGFQ